MLDPSRALQDAIINFLKADAGVSGMIVDRVYASAPKNRTFPDMTIGGTQVLPDKGDEADGAEAFITLHAWSQHKDGDGEVMTLARHVASALDDAELELGNGLRLVDFVLESITYLRDPDGVTRHAVITMKALTEPAS